MQLVFSDRSTCRLRIRLCIDREVILIVVVVPSRLIVLIIFSETHFMAAEALQNIIIVGALVSFDLDSSIFPNGSVPSLSPTRIAVRLKRLFFFFRYRRNAHFLSFVLTMASLPSLLRDTRCHCNQSTASNEYGYEFVS
jgi:hypothetical protein